MRVGFFRAYGVLTLLLSPGALGMTTNDLSALVLCSAVIVVGVGLLFLRKWAALYFSVPLFCYGVWIFFSSIEAEPFPGNLLVMVYSFSLMLPLFVTIRIWPHLVWGGKWYV